MLRRAKTLIIYFACSAACVTALGPGVLAAPRAAPAASQCESIKDDDAYNRCLAASGPQRHGPRRYAEPENGVKAIGAQPGTASPKARKPARNEPFLNVPLRR